MRRAGTGIIIMGTGMGIEGAVAPTLRQAQGEGFGEVRAYRHLMLSLSKHEVAV
jgi:hypothetical protein